MITEYCKIALRNIKQRKLRSFLTVIGILLSVTTILVLISLSLGLENAVKEQFRLLGTDKFFIQPKGQLAGPGTSGAVSLTENDVQVIQKISGVKEVSSWTASNARIEHGNQIRYTAVIGIDMETIGLFMETGSHAIDEGRALKKSDIGSVMIGSQYKNNNFLGKPVKTGDRIIINDVEFKIKGILESVGNPSDDRLLYMPLEDFRKVFNIPNRIDMITIQVTEEKALQSIVDVVQRKLLQSRGLTEKTRDFTILTPEELLKSFGSILTIITGFLVGVAAISLLAGAIGIANTMYTSVLERTKEIGVMKAIGAQNHSILIIFLTESGILGLAGGLLGVIFGTIISKLIEYVAVNKLDTTLLQVVIPPYLIIACLLFAFVIGSVSGLWPASKAIKIKPVEALRHD